MAVSRAQFRYYTNKLQTFCFTTKPNQGAISAYISSVWFSSVAQSCPTLCDPIDCNPPGSLVLGILQARTLEWVAISFSRGLHLGIKSASPALPGEFFTTEAPGSPHFDYILICVFALLYATPFLLHCELFQARRCVGCHSKQVLGKPQEYFPKGILINHNC